MDLISEVAQRLKQIPVMVWLIGAALALILIAVFAFGYPLNSFSGLALYGLFFGGHFLMHSSHGGHGNHAGNNGEANHQNHDSGSGGTEQSASQNPAGSEHSGHRGGCH